MLILKILHPLWRFHFRKLFILFAFSIVFFTILKLFVPEKTYSTSLNTKKHSFESQIIPIDTDDLVAESSANPLESAATRKQCPLCFGSKFCEEFHEAVPLNNSHPILEKQNRIVYKAVWKTTEPVFIRVLPYQLARNFHHSLCQKAKLPLNCNVISAVNKTYNDFKRYSLKNIDEFYTFLGNNRSQVPFPLCLNEKLFFHLELMFDEDENENISSAEQTMLLTTLALNPEALALRFLTYINTNVPIMPYYGSCGRTWIIKDGLTPLKDFLREPFEIRATLAGKILQIVDDFLDDDPDWFMLFTGFYYDNLVVDKNDDVLIVNVEDLVVVDKNIVQPIQEVGESAYEPCNQECLSKFSHNMLHSQNMVQMCELLPQYAHLMYALICQQILSNIEEHRVKNYFGMDANTKPQKSDDPGLLHGIPDKDRESIEELLKECVLETSEGGRIQAAEELRDLLNDYAIANSFLNVEDKDEYEIREEDENME